MRTKIIFLVILLFFGFRVELVEAGCVDWDCTWDYDSSGSKGSTCECNDWGTIGGHVEKSCDPGEYVCNRGCCAVGNVSTPAPVQEEEEEEEAYTPPPPCSPSCSSPLCGQANGCGGSCSNSDDGVPGALTLNPSGGSVTISPGQQVTVSWSSDSKADYYELELYRPGAGCSDTGAYCGQVTGTSYSFSPIYGTYFYQVRGINTSCGSDSGNFVSASFNIYGSITGQVKFDENWNVALVGGVCQLGGAPGQKPGGGSTVTAVGSTTDSSPVQGNGNYSLSVLAGSGQYTVSLVSGDPDNWICTCPENCVYSGISTPRSGLDYFVSEQRLPWFQVDGGNIHADGGNVSVEIPSTCVGACDPYLITGTSGLVSYTAGLSLGDFDVENINETGDEWRSQTDYQGDRTDYGYFARILADDPVETEIWSGSEPVEDGVFLGEGVTQTTGGDWDITGGQKSVILVPNDVVIENNINVADGSFLAIISSGNITVDDAVTNLEGVYLADGLINSCEASSSVQLQAEGIFVGWTGINLCRDYGDDTNNTSPVEVFVYRPDLQVNAYNYLLRSDYNWQEVAP